MAQDAFTNQTEQIDDPRTRLVIRPALAGDLPAVLGLLAEDTVNPPVSEELGPPLPAAYLDAFAAMSRDQDNRLMVAELSGRVAGTFQLTIIQGLMYRGARTAQVEAVRVAADLRGRGIGEAMMRWAIAESRCRGCLRLQLTSNKARGDAHRFYERLGFRRTHEGMKLDLLT